MKIGYARVSTVEQNEVRQIQAFENLGIEKVYLDKKSGKDTDRPQLKDMLEFVREGDCLYIESISRLARSTQDLLKIVFVLQQKKVQLISLKEQFDTMTPQGRFMLTMFGAMAELERESILERQKEGIAIAKANGKYKGKPPIKIDKDKFIKECELWRDGKQTATATMRKFNLKPNTFYRRVAELNL